MYRTKTYIAGEWTGDRDLIEKLYEWNANKWLVLDFHDAHKICQARDTSLPCSIKHSLFARLAVSKTFVLIVGEDTDNVTKGSCRYCRNYKGGVCLNGYNVDMRSFIDFECEKAVRDGMRIIVLYNGLRIEREKCPIILRYQGMHLAAKIKRCDGVICWNYADIRDVFMQQ